MTILGSLAYLFVPFGGLIAALTTCNFKRIDLIDPILIIVACTWSIIIESLPIDELVRPWTDTAHTMITGIISGTLGFLLPLYLNDAMDKNKVGNTLYEAFCGDVVALGWEMTVFGSKDGEIDRTKYSREVNEEYEKVFAIMRTMPQTLKHIFRGDFNYEKMLDVKDTKNYNTPLMMKIVDKLRELDTTGEHVIESTMFLLMHHIRKLMNLEYEARTEENIKKSDSRQGAMTVLMKKWNDIYSSYGSLSSLSLYKIPILFEFVLYSALSFYVILLPWSFSDRNSWNVFIVFIIVYFFFSLAAAARIIQNPFLSNDIDGDGVNDINVFQTVSKAAKDATQLINDIEQYGLNEKIWKKDGNTAKNQNLIRVEMMEKRPVNFKLNNFMLRQRLGKGNYKHV